MADQIAKSQASNSDPVADRRDRLVRRIGDLHTRQARQYRNHGGVSLSHCHEYIGRSVGIDQHAAIGQSGTRSRLRAKAEHPTVGPRQGNVASDRRLALAVVIFQRNLRTVLVAHLQIVALARGYHVVKQLLVIALALDDSVMLARLCLELMCLTRLQGFCGLAVVYCKGLLCGRGHGSS